MYGISVQLFKCVVSCNRVAVRYKSGDSTKRLLEFLADMPKPNSARIADAQRQRQHISKKSEKYAPSTVYLQVLGSGAKGAPNTLYLFTDQKRYLFNCGECTQRLAHEHKVKLSRLDHIFITSKTWRNIGGLPGLSLTLQDVGVPSITLHGPEGLDELYNATRRFVIMKDMKVRMAPCSPTEDFEDNVMTVKYVLLGSHKDIFTTDPKPPTKRVKLSDSLEKEFEEFIHDETDYYRHDIKHTEAKGTEMKTNKNVGFNKARPKSRPGVDKDVQKKKTEKVLQELQKKADCSVSYICTLKKRLGTLDLAKCVELGVKPGPMLGQLKNGLDVVLPDGTLVLSKNVKTPDDPGPVFIVMDVPDISYLKVQEFSAHFDNALNPPENIPALMVHFTPLHIFLHPDYRAFMALFGPTTRHLTLNTQNTCLGSEAVHRTQHKLHLLDHDIFPMLKDVSVPAVWNALPSIPKTNSTVRLKGLEELKTKFQNIVNMETTRDFQPPADDDCKRVDTIAGRTLTMYHLRPKKQLDRSAEPKLHIQDYLQETMDVDGFVGSLEQFRRLVDSLRYAKNGTAKEYPKVVFLGTGSCIPSKTRNTSCIVLQISEDRSMLLDCGEGTFGQLVRFYGPKRVNAFLRTLKAIYVSHLHADHHIGLIGVLQARRQAFEELNPDGMIEPVYLLAPGQIVSWLSIYDQQFEKIYGDYTLIPNQNLLIDALPQTDQMTSAVLASIGLESVQTCLVSHCPNAFGVALVVDQNKITYSGDTIPCEALVKLGENSTLLIHEATMEDELADEARTKMHSTTTQAIEVGRQMNARYTVLTHFSQRYARLPRLNANILNDNNSVGIAFDNMQITMSDLELLPHMYAPLQLMFAEHCVEMELKAAHRARQKDRRSSTPNLIDRYTEHKRKCSPGCRGMHSLSGCRHVRYRESNASRLRHEMKAAAVVDSTGHSTRSLRSKSSSPGRSPSSPGSKSCSPAKQSIVSEVIAPLPTPTEENLAAENHTGSTRKSSQINLMELPPTIAYTNSQVSEQTYKVKDLTDRSRTIPSEHVLETRSRILNSVSRLAVSEEVTNFVTCNNTFKKNANKIFETEKSSGYGKPLVTPTNKKLTIRKEPNHISTPPSDKSGSPVLRSRSPARFNAENRRYAPPPPCYKRITSNTELPTVGSQSNNRLRPSSSTLRRTPSMNLQRFKDVGCASANKLRSSPVYLRDTPSVNLQKMKEKQFVQYRSTSPSNQSKNSSPRSQGQGARVGPQSNSFTKNLVNPAWNDGKRSPDNTSRLNYRTSRDTSEERNENLKRSNRYGEFSKKWSPFRESETEKKSYKSVSIVGRGTFVPNNKCFTPQLEDIKSSFILLNKRQDRNKKACLDHERRISSAGSKPKPLNESERREQLTEIRRKFQSRGFFNDSKYDKIEGLNWISWK